MYACEISFQQLYQISCSLYNTRVQYTVCPRNLGPVYNVTYCIKWNKTFWTYSILQNHGTSVLLKDCCVGYTGHSVTWSSWLRRDGCGPVYRCCCSVCSVLPAVFSSSPFCQRQAGPSYPPPSRLVYRYKTVNSERRLFTCVLSFCRRYSNPRFKPETGGA